VSDHIGELEPAGVEYVMEDVVRLELKLGRTTLVIMGPQEETDNARILVEGAKDLFIQVVTKEQEKRDAELDADWPDEPELEVEEDSQNNEELRKRLGLDD